MQKEFNPIHHYDKQLITNKNHSNNNSNNSNRSNSNVSGSLLTPHPIVTIATNHNDRTGIQHHNMHDPYYKLLMIWNSIITILLIIFIIIFYFHYYYKLNKKLQWIEEELINNLEYNDPDHPNHDPPPPDHHNNNNNSYDRDQRLLLTTIDTNIWNDERHGNHKGDDHQYPLKKSLLFNRRKSNKLWPSMNIDMFRDICRGLSIDCNEMKFYEGKPGPPDISSM
ncbi:unnamed protein product [Schistosoma rodhaini]|nr:unnamed protein product [Schistosoma rodhaini]